jgi:quinol-cytochrome oxidoreductase complex cytochrome b subunit
LDVKPENVMEFERRPVIIDYGIARDPQAASKASGTIRGTVDYIDPVFFSEHFDPKTTNFGLCDQYSYGVMFYQLFSGRYKLRYEMLWITGIILGVVTVLEAYSGYDLILNIRGQLALNIGYTLTFLTPVIGADLAKIIFGFSPNDLLLRFYAFHVFIIPIIMLALMAVHLPRNLVLDIPVASAITGIIIIMGGLFPVEVGIKYDPSNLTEITFPEWYFTSLYAFVRVGGLDALIGGIILPTIFILIFLIVPFFDRGKKIAMIDRPFWIALGVAALGQIVIVTVWGFRAANPLIPLTDPNQLVIDSSLFFGRS